MTIDYGLYRAPPPFNIVPMYSSSDADICPSLSPLIIVPPSFRDASSALRRDSAACSGVKSSP